MSAPTGADVVDPPAQTDASLSYPQVSESAPVHAAYETQTVSDSIDEHEAIARLAYSYWEERGCHGGSAEEDWARAEQEYRSRRGLGAAG
jgi:hypothetical protein